MGTSSYHGVNELPDRTSRFLGIERFFAMGMFKVLLAQHRCDKMIYFTRERSRCRNLRYFSVRNVSSVYGKTQLYYNPWTEALYCIAPVLLNTERFYSRLPAKHLVEHDRAPRFGPRPPSCRKRANHCSEDTAEPCVCLLSPKRDCNEHSRKSMSRRDGLHVNGQRHKTARAVSVTSLDWQLL